MAMAYLRDLTTMNRQIVAAALTIVIAIAATSMPLRAQNGQCLSGGCAITLSQYPNANQSTTSNSFVTVATNIYAGEWARYSVTSGQVYEWTLCSADGASAPYDSQLTLRTDANPGTVLCYSDDLCGDDAKIRWTASLSGYVRVQVNVYNCGVNQTNTTVRWRCVSCTPPPLPPTIVSPGSASAPGTTITTTTPTMTWNASAGATSYGLYISIAPYGPGNLVYTNENVPVGTSFQIPSGFLFTGNAYRWNMVAKNSGGESPVSNTLYFQVISTPPPESAFHWPVADPALVTQEYASPANNEYHTGLDMVATNGDLTVSAAASGMVRTVPLNTYVNENHYMGNVVIVEHPQLNLYTLYAHLDGIAVSDGQTVVAGAPIGTMGNTGCRLNNPPCNAHLHFEVKHFGVLGNLDDDLGPEWGYTPLPHTNLWGYVNPRSYLDHELSQLVPTAVVASGNQIVRTGPDPASYTTTVTNITSGQEFSALAEYNGWYEIYLPSTNGPGTGWIQASPNSLATLVRVSDASAGSGGGINVRSSPMASGSSISKVWDRQTFSRVNVAPGSAGCSDGWAQIAVGANAVGGPGTGWVCADYLSIIGGEQPGDINGDGVVNLIDRDIFVAVLLGTDADPLHENRSDLNQDGLANGRDIQPFTDVLLGP